MTALLTPPSAAEAYVPVAVATPVRLREVTKRFGHGESALTALERVSLTAAEGEFVCLLGTSGCGKSTLLSLIAGLERPSAGEVLVAGGQPALMFQDAALFPWLTVAENVAFPLRMQGEARAARRTRVEELLRLVRLDGFAARRPHELSGGMRQRVALARALAQRARVLLMDEPFGALDAMTRELLHGELERIWREAGLTILFVTHDVSEAVRLADRVIVLSSRPGRVVTEFCIDVPRPRKIGSPQTAAFVAEVTRALRPAALEVQR